MMHFNADPRSHQGIGSGCCCEPLIMKPGEKNLVCISYGAWSIPIGELIHGFNFKIDKKDDGCNLGSIQGEPFPSASVSTVTTPVDTPVTVQLGTLVTPLETGLIDHTYSVESLCGLEHGSITLNEDTGELIYTPNQSFEGFDVLWYTVKDRHGREDTASVVIEVGSAVGSANPEWTSDVPYISVPEVTTDQYNHSIQFPIYLPLGVKECETFRLTVKQSARNCNCTIFDHIMCFDIRANCG